MNTNDLTPLDDTRHAYTLTQGVSIMAICDAEVFPEERRESARRELYVSLSEWISAMSIDEVVQFCDEMGFDLEAETDYGALRFTPDEAREEIDALAPGETFAVILP